MNELIEKLAEQAMSKAVAKNFTGEKLELRMPSEAWAKEFTELIVRECCNVLTENVEVALDASGSPVYPEGLIYEHFGVESA